MAITTVSATSVSRSTDSWSASDAFGIIVFLSLMLSPITATIIGIFVPATVIVFTVGIAINIAFMLTVYAVSFIVPQVH